MTLVVFPASTQRSVEISITQKEPVPHIINKPQHNNTIRPVPQPGLGETTYKTSCLPCAGSVYLYDFRIRAGFPYIQLTEGAVCWSVACALRPHNPN